MNLKEDIYVQNVQFKIANKDLRVKLDNLIGEKVKSDSLAHEYKIKYRLFAAVLCVSIFFNLFAYCVLTK
jgi:hypothetical protein